MSHDASMDEVTRRYVELLTPLGPIVARPLLGTVGLYLDERVFGVVHDGKLYFRTSARTSRKYEQAGGRPFVYGAKGFPRSIMPYHLVPPLVLEDRDLACAWAYEAAALQTC